MIPRPALLALWTIAALAAAGPAGAQPGADAPTERALAEKRERQRELDEARQAIEASRAANERIAAEVAALRADRARIVEESIAAAARAQAAERQAAASEARLSDLDAREATLRASLFARREVIAEVLAALQRMGRRPPPALLVAPEDMLGALRSAMLLGAVLPDMGEAARVVATDLEALAAVRRAIAAEVAALKGETATLAAERLRLDALGEARQARALESERALEAERLKAAGLARQATNLEHLIGRMETEIDAARRAAEAARTSMAARQGGPAGTRIGPTADPLIGRLQPSQAFTALRARLNPPVSGVRIRDFGAPDALGGVERGQVFATRAGATVTAPADGWVVFSGPFRSFGQLLILNVGDGYHVVLAGMDKITVDLGQFVSAGEPVATMGATPPPAQAAVTGSAQPVLHVEFRKDGASIDPSPWWASRPPAPVTNERVRG